jgi:hypothetical protein
MFVSKACWRIRFWHSKGGAGRLHPSGSNVIKLLTVVFSEQTRVFVPGRLFHASLMFAGKAITYPSEAPTLGRLLALLANVRLGWKSFAGGQTTTKIRKLRQSKVL